MRLFHTFLFSPLYYTKNTRPRYTLYNNTTYSIKSKTIKVALNVLWMMVLVKIMFLSSLSTIRQGLLLHRNSHYGNHTMIPRTSWFIKEKLHKFCSCIYSIVGIIQKIIMKWEITLGEGLLIRKGNWVKCIEFQNMYSK